MIGSRSARRLALVLSFLATLPAFASTPLVPYLIEDLTPGHRDVPPRLHFWSSTLGEVVFFAVAEEEIGLWLTDGTAAGTHRIYDGIADWHDAGNLPVQWNGSLYYPVVTDGGTWLYRTDGTTPGTAAVAKIPGWYGRAPCGDGKLCFAAEGNRVAVTDGTAAGTKELLRTASGPETHRARQMTALGGRVYFNAYDDQNGLCMTVPAGLASRQVCGELWTTDGTVAGTHLVKDILPGGAPGAPENLFASSSGKLYFAAADPAFPQVAQAWVSDGTAAGTRMLSTKPSDWLGSPVFFELEGRVFFTNSDGDLYETDGTPEETRSLRDRFPSTNLILTPIDAWNGQILLSAVHLQGPHELWSLDGATLTKLAEVPYPFIYLGYLQSKGVAYFITDAGEVWTTDGTAAGTGRRFSVPATGASMYPVAVTPTRLYYGEGYNRYVSDGTEAGTHRIDLNVRVANSTSAGVSVLNGTSFFMGSDTFGVTDGTPGGTTVLLEEGGFELFAHEGHTYFRHQGVLWKTDGTVEGTLPAGDWLGADWPTPPAFIGERAVFAADSGSGPVLRRDPDGSLHDLGVEADGFGSFVGAGGGVAFWAAFPLRLMFTDGTAAGTRVVSTGFHSAGDVVPLGARGLFGATKTGETTLRLWVTDFTADGTRPVKDFPGPDDDEVIPLLTWRNLFIFRIGPYETREVWRSDGTTEGTFPLTSGEFDAVLADGDELVLVRFANGGYEVWTSDGTQAGTRRRDVHHEAAKAGQPFVMAGGGVGVLYSPRPKEIHIRNHRTGAVQVIDSSGFRELIAGVGNGNVVFFSGYRGSSGREIWAVRLDGTAPQGTSFVDVRYVGTASTSSGIGAVFRVHLEAGGAKPPRVVATTVDGTLSAERDYVPFTREIVFDDDRDVTLVVPLRPGHAKGTLSVVLSAPENATITDGVATAQVGWSGRRRTVRK